MTELRAKVLSSLRWSAAVKLLEQLFRWGVTIYVIKLLTPDDYGLMGLAMVFITLLMLINELGFDAVLVQREGLTERVKRQVFGIVFFTNAVFFCALMLGAPLLAAFYEEPRLAPLLQTLALQFVIVSFAIVPQSMLARELELKKIALIDMAAALVGSTVQLLLALNGYGVWSLVWGNLTLVLLRTLGLNLASPYLRLPLLSLRGAKDIFSFGGYVMLSRVASFFYTQSDVMIAGKLLSKDALGVYYVALNLANMPTNKLMAVINQVAFPAYARVQRDRALSAGYFLKAVRMMSIVGFPLMWGLSSIAPELVNVLLEEKWAGVIMPLQLICLCVPVRMVNSLTPPLFYGLGVPVHAFHNTVVLAVVMSGAFFVGCQFGLLGLVLAWVACFPLVALYNMSRSLPVVNLGALDVARNMARPALAAAGMYASVLAARAQLEGSLAEPLLLAALVLSGGAAYAVLIFFVDRRGLQELLSLRK